jgi:hypothetical protein
MYGNNSYNAGVEEVSKYLGTPWLVLSLSFEDPFPTCSTYTDAEDAHVVRPNYSVVLHGLTWNRLHYASRPVSHLGSSQYNTGTFFLVFDIFETEGNKK